MEHIDVEKVVQVDGPERANEKLALGYTLLAIVPAMEPTGRTYVAYVLGMPRPKPPHPQTPDLGELGEQLC